MQPRGVLHRTGAQREGSHPKLKARTQGKAALSTPLSDHHPPDKSKRVSELCCATVTSADWLAGGWAELRTAATAPDSMPVRTQQCAHRAPSSHNLTRGLGWALGLSPVDDSSLTSYLRFPLFPLQENPEPGVVGQACNPSTEAEASGSL